MILERLQAMIKGNNYFLVWILKSWLFVDFNFGWQRYYFELKNDKKADLVSVQLYLTFIRKKMKLIAIPAGYKKLNHLKAIHFR